MNRDTYNREFKTVRNRIRRFAREQLVAGVLGWLAKVDPADRQTLTSSPPWVLLLLLKWSVLYGDKFGRRALKERDLIDLIERTKALEEHSGMPDEWDPPSLFIRAVLFQQDWLQNRATSWSIGRQVALFEGFDESTDMGRSFLQSQGITIQTFQELGLVLLTGLAASSGKPAFDAFFDALRPFYGADVDRFLQTLSVTPESARDMLVSQFPTEHSASEFRERTPFEEKPLFKVDGEYHPIYGPLLNKTIENRVYRVLRKEDASRFMRHFGPAFERYVGESVARYGCPFASESELQTKLGADGKVVDFAIWEQRANILVDAKGVELGVGVMTSKSSMRIKDRISDSVTKGIVQASETIRRIEESGSLGHRGRLDSYVLIVTYQDLWLGNGEFFLRTVGQHSAALQEIQSSSSHLKMSNVFLLSIHELELLVECVTPGNELVDFLEYAKRMDAESQSMCLKVGMHLGKRYGTKRSPKHVRAKFETLRDKIASRMRPGPSPT